jgi:Rrf2 family iron-sulfur cluster assembly transcriptional regulator
MKITALEEYGFRCMVLFAKVEKPLTIPEIAEKEALSIPYVGKLLRLLREAGLIDAERGRNGGYTISRSPSQIKLSDVFAALGEPVFGTHHCDKYQNDEVDNHCVHAKDCTVKDVWRSFYDIFDMMMNKITLQDIVESKNSRSAFLEIAGIETDKRN